MEKRGASVSAYSCVCTSSFAVFDGPARGTGSCAAPVKLGFRAPAHQKLRNKRGQTKGRQKLKLHAAKAGGIWTFIGLTGKLPIKTHDGVNFHSKKSGVSIYRLRNRKFLSLLEWSKRLHLDLKSFAVRLLPTPDNVSINDNRAT